MDRYKELSDKKLYELAKKLDVKVDEDMSREDVEEFIAVVEAEELEEDASGERKKAKKKGVITLQYISSGTTSFDKTKWNGHMRRSMPEKKARLLLNKFPNRFKIIE